MAKKYYGVAGTNGYGVYDDYCKVLNSKPYVKEYKVKGFKRLKDAEEYAVHTYESLQGDSLGFYRIDSLQRLNWFHYQKQARRLFIPV